MALGQWLAEGYPAPPFSQKEKGVIPLSLWARVRVRATGSPFPEYK